MSCDISRGRGLSCKDAIGGLKAVYFINSGDLGTPVFDADNQTITKLDGITVFLAPGMKVGSFAIAQKANLFFGTWNTNSLTSVKVKDMSEMLEENVRFAMCFFAGIQYAIPAEIVYAAPHA